MADISTYTKQILSSSKGETVRDSIINAAKSMDALGTNANTLDGHPVDDFVTIKDLQNAINDVAKEVDKLNGKSVNGGINYKLNETMKAKNAIANAIINKGVVVTSNDAFDDYPEKVMQITGVNNPGVLDAYEQGTYYAESDGYDAYTEVNVDISNSIIDLNVTENGTYYPESYNASGFKTVTVSVAGGDSGPFNVYFYDGSGNIIYTATDVKYGSDAVYVGTTPTKEGYIFSGWDPNPYNVKSDLYCYPKFTDPNTQTSGLITDTWEDIVAHPENYAIGSYKTLELYGAEYITNPSTMKGYITMYPTTCVMEKVYEGECDTASTWLCKTLPSFNGSAGSNLNFNFYPEDIELDPNAMYGWNESNYIKTLRNWLNSEFLYKMMPGTISAAIKPVTKYSLVMDPQGFQYIRNNPTLDKIWVPSLSEMYLESVDESTSTQNNFYEKEEKGVSYAGYYNTKNSRIKKLQGSNTAYPYSLRSCGIGISYNTYNYFYYIRGITTGGAVNNDLHSAKLCFGFCL